MNRNSKRLTIVALLILIFGLSIGFASFSNNLTISARGTVKPQTIDFKVMFTKYDGSKCTTTPITSIQGTPISSGYTIKPQTAIIENGTVIKNMGVQFNSPGQAVTYKACVYNAGSNTAYLTAVNIGSANCSPVGTTSTVNYISCNASSLTVTIGGERFPKSLSDTTVNHTLKPKESQLVEIKLEYGSNADGSEMDVSFSSTSLVYESTPGSTSPGGGGTDPGGGSTDPGGGDTDPGGTDPGGTGPGTT